METPTNFSEDVADEIEKNHVFDVYDKISGHFSETRHSPWPNVNEFIKSFASGSFLIDVGCGNGKYLNCCKSLFSIGCDRSNKLLEVCRSRGDHQVVNADCRVSPFRDGIADAVICIAVIHHLATVERRLQALKDISRLLSKGGRALVYVWAKEQKIGSKKSTYLLQKKSEVSEREETYPSAILPVHENRTNFKHTDVLVPWKLKSKTSGRKELEPDSNPPAFLRFYHVFQEGELESLCSSVPNISVCRSYYDEGRSVRESYGENVNKGGEVVTAQSTAQQKIKSVNKISPLRNATDGTTPLVDMDQVKEVKVIEKINGDLGEKKNTPTENNRKRHFLAPPLSMALRERKTPVVLPKGDENRSPLRKKKKSKSSQKLSSRSTATSVEQSFVDDYRPQCNYYMTKSLEQKVPFLMSLRQRKASKIFDYSSDEESSVPRKNNLHKLPLKPAVVKKNKAKLSEYELEIKKKIEERKKIFAMFELGDAKRNLIRALKNV